MHLEAPCFACPLVVGMATDMAVARGVVAVSVALLARVVPVSAHHPGGRTRGCRGLGKSLLWLGAERQTDPSCSLKAKVMFGLLWGYNMVCRALVCCFHVLEIILQAVCYHPVGCARGVHQIWPP
jgi:hypothetical protein